MCFVNSYSFIHILFIQCKLFVKPPQNVICFHLSNQNFCLTLRVFSRLATVDWTRGDSRSVFIVICKVIYWRRHRRPSVTWSSARLLYFMSLYSRCPVISVYSTKAMFVLSGFVAGPTCRTSQTRQYQLAISRIPFCTMNVWTLITFYWISKLLFAESLSLSCQVTHQFPSVAGNQ